MKTKPLLLESQTCSRCYGTGHYSWCARYGSTCFKCHGRGSILTKRGAVAQRFLHSLSTVRVDQLGVGDSFRSVGVTNGAEVYGYWAKVERITPRDGGLFIETTSKYENSGLQCGSDYTVQKARSAEEVAETRALGLEFQSKLGKSGKIKVIDIRL